MSKNAWKYVVLAVLAGTLLSAGCKSPAQRSRVLTKDQEQQIAANVLSKPPAVQNPKKVNFDNKIHLLGYDVQGKPTRGASFDLTLYFRVDNPVHGDWKIFVHFEAPGKRRQPFDHYGVGNLYPVGQWKKGEIIKDVVKINVPKDWPAGPTQVLVGFFDWGAWSKASQNRRLPLDARDKNKGTGDSRALVATLEIGGAAPAQPAGGARRPEAPRANLAPAVIKAKKAAAPTIDGKLDDAAWTAAAASRKFHQPDGRPLNATYETTAKVSWDDANLYVAFTTKDDEVANKFTANDSTLWEGDVVELFIKPDATNNRYFEFQWAPNKARFDAQFTGHRAPKWEEAAKWNAAGAESAVVQGDGGWTVEAKIPFAALGLKAPPSAGTKWAANMYRIDNKGTHNMGFMGAWAPVGGDFHNLTGAGTIEFVQ